MFTPDAVGGGDGFEAEGGPEMTSESNERRGAKAEQRKAEQGEYGEPWQYETIKTSVGRCFEISDGIANIACIYDDDTSLNKRSTAEHMANAKRIVSCVNALRGIPDPEAYVKAFEKMKDILTRISTENGLQYSDIFAACDEALALANQVNGGSESGPRPQICR